MSKISVTLFFLLLISSLPGSVLAAKPTLITAGKLDQPAAPNTTITYFHLLALIFPGLEHPEGAFDTVAPATVPVRHLDREYETQPLSGPFKFQTVSGLPYKARNRRLFLLHLELLGEPSATPGPVGEYSLLALFQLDPAPKLLDVVDIRADRFNGFWDKPPLVNLNPSTQAVIIHHNSN